MLLRVAPRYAFVVGVDVGETRVRVELFDFAMTLLASVEYPLDPAARPSPDWWPGTCWPASRR